MQAVCKAGPHRLQACVAYRPRLVGGGTCCQSFQSCLPFCREGGEERDRVSGGGFEEAAGTGRMADQGRRQRRQRRRPGAGQCRARTARISCRRPQGTRLGLRN